MKKKVIITVSILLVLALIVGGGFLYFRTTPEYALLCVLRDVRSQGIYGLQPHVTGSAKTVVDFLCSSGDGGWLSKLWGYASQSDLFTTLINECAKIQWDLEDILKSKNRATVIVSFDYKGWLTGTVDLSMVKEAGKWKIDGLSFPDFD